MHLRCGLEQAECGSNTGGDTNYTQRVAEAGGRLGRQAAEGPDTAEGGGQVGHLVDLWVALADGPPIGGQEGGSRHSHQVVVLWGVGGPLEHVQHPNMGGECMRKTINTTFLHKDRSSTAIYYTCSRFFVPAHNKNTPLLNLNLIHHHTISIAEPELPIFLAQNVEDKKLV